MIASSANYHIIRLSLLFVGRNVIPNGKNDDLKYLYDNEDTKPCTFGLKHSVLLRAEISGIRIQNIDLVNDEECRENSRQNVNL